MLLRPCTPSTGTQAPLTQLALGDARNATRSATSFACPKRPNGSSRLTNSAIPPGPSSPGNPYSLARTLRVFATHLADRPGPLPAELAALIADHGEAAVAQAALVRAAVRERDLDGEA